MSDRVSLERYTELAKCGAEDFIGLIEWTRTLLNENLSAKARIAQLEAAVRRLLEAGDELKFQANWSGAVEAGTPFEEAIDDYDDAARVAEGLVGK